MLVNELKKYTRYTKNKIDKVIIKTPDKYKEIQENNNINSSLLKAHGECNYLKQSSNITLNSHSFIVYDKDYTQLGGVIFYKYK